jgi:hypothetical protein
MYLASKSATRSWWLVRPFRLFGSPEPGRKWQCWTEKGEEETRASVAESVLSRILSWNLVNKLDERSDKVLFPNRLQHHASLIVFAIVFVSLSHDVACPARLSCFFVPEQGAVARVPKIERSPDQVG